MTKLRFRARHSFKPALAVAAFVALFSCQPFSFAQEAAKAVLANTAPCAVKMVDPTQSGADADKIVELLRGITKALADHDFTGMAKFMDENCSCYNEHTKKLVTGRDNIIADVKNNVEAEEHRLKVPPIEYTVDHPYVRVTGSDTATVNFVLIKKIGGDRPQQYESHCTDVFMKHDGEWKKVLFRGDDWKQVK
jgi:hypothetical protein